MCCGCEAEVLSNQAHFGARTAEFACSCNHRKISTMGLEMIARTRRFALLLSGQFAAGPRAGSGLSFVSPVTSSQVNSRRKARPSTAR